MDIWDEPTIPAGAKQEFPPVSISGGIPEGMEVPEGETTIADHDLYNLVKENTVAIVKTSPQGDKAIQALYKEALAIRSIALNRVIVTNDDFKLATEDLSIIARIKKALEGKRKEWTLPIREKLDSVNEAFKLLISPIEQADQVTRSKSLEYRQIQERKRQEAELIEREKLELARREAELNDGEITVDLSPVDKPEKVPDNVRGEMGSQGIMKVRKWRLLDIKQVPPEFLLVDAGMVTKLVKAGIGSISGIEIYEEETVRITTH